MTSEIKSILNGVESDDAESWDIMHTLTLSDPMSVCATNLARVRVLLDAGLSGISKNRAKMQSIKAKIDNPVVSSNIKTKLPIEKPAKSASKMLKITFTREQHALLKSVMDYNAAILDDTEFYFHNILIVAVWSALETYIQGTVAEIFSTHPDLLASDRPLNTRDVLLQRDKIVEYLITQEMDNMGRKSFYALQKYLKSRLKIQFSDKWADKLTDMYFIRNVVAHNAGVLRPDQLDKVPQGVGAESSQLRVSREYLNEAIDCVRDAVIDFNNQSTKRYRAVRTLPNATGEPREG